MAASKFVEHGGGADINSQTPQLKERLNEVSGLPINDAATLENLLFNESVGLLTTFEVGGFRCPEWWLGYFFLSRVQTTSAP